ncbi:hypothetical protein ACEPPN_015420 [Leptodophora sp. 'Broadleaf-Isolate-01']
MLPNIIFFSFLVAFLNKLSSATEFPNLRTRQNATQPNIVFILTDDQDLQMDSMNYLPLIKKHLSDQGMFYSQHYCTVAVCCPSRVNLWTGRAAHNTNVTDLVPPYGGYPKFISQGLNDNYLPVWLQQAGYNTYYVGKLFNSHSTENYNQPFPAGFTGSEFLLDPYTYQYYNPGFQRNKDPPVVYPGNYSTDLVAQKAFGFLDDAVNSGSPFFLAIAPIAPHANVNVTFNANGTSTVLTSGPMPAIKYQSLFPDAVVPRTKNFNPDTPSGAGWVRQLPQLSEPDVERNDEWYRNRLRALQSVDEMVDQLMARLEQYNLLDNTYIFYTTDNGYHVGQHRLQPGKSCGYEEDINVPLVVRGPGIARNMTTDIVTSHTDLAPTILKIFGIPMREEFDGSAIPLTPEDISEIATGREHVNVEFWGNRYNPEDGNAYVYTDGVVSLVNNTYKAIRLIGQGYNLYYSVWCSHDHELYDMDADPHQMENLFPLGFTKNSTLASWTANETILGVSTLNLASRLDALMFVLKSCQGDECREPWAALQPDGNVSNLKEALQPKFDNFYQNQVPRVQFSRCEPGHIIDAEGPQFEPNVIYSDGGDPQWAIWT